MNGLKGLCEAIAASVPRTIVQTPTQGLAQGRGRPCIIGLIRASLAFVSWKDRKALMADMKAIYRAENADAAWQELKAFEAKWGKRYPTMAPTWRRAWEQVFPPYAFPPEIRRMIYTTNAVESLHRSLRKIIKTRGGFPNDHAAPKLLYLALRNAGVRWHRPVAWTEAMALFAILFGDRLTVVLAQSLGHTSNFSRKLS